MDFSDIGQTILNYVPHFSGALVGPASIAIGSIIASIFGNDKNKHEKMQKIIITDPNTIIKLRQIETDHQLEIHRLNMKASRKKNNKIAVCIGYALTIIALIYLFIFHSACN